MEYKKIEKLVYCNNIISRNNYESKKEYELKLDNMLIENINKCLDKDIPIEMNEEDFIKIYKAYLRLKKNNYDINIDFIFKLVNTLDKKLNYLEIVENI